MLNRLVSILKPDPRLLASGVLLVLAFPPWNLSFLSWFALVPFLLALEKRELSLKAATRKGVELGFWMSLGVFFWIAHTLATFGQIPLVIGVIGLLLFCFLGEPQFMILAPVIPRFWEALQRQRTTLARTAWVTLLALAYSALDWGLPKLFVDTLGHSLYANPWLRQAADLGGAPLLTFAQVFVNLSLALLISELRRREEPSIWAAIHRAAGPLATSLMILGALALYGRHRTQEITEWMRAQARDTVRFAVIQANIGDFDKISAERGYRDAADKVIGAYLKLSDEALRLSPAPDFLVWPETAYPSTFRTPSSSADFGLDQRVENFVTTRRASLIFGGYDRRGGRDFNSIFFLTPRGVPGVPGEGDLQIYRKNLLLPFGEFLPGTDLFPSLKSAFPMVGNFGRGPGPSHLLATGGFLRPEGPVSIRLNPVICYEILFPEFTRAPAEAHAEAILNVTNDGWFGPWAEPALHLALTTFRSIETRRPQVRSTNTGISALILPTGEITRPTEIGKPGILLGEVPILPRKTTPFMAGGHAFIWIGALAWALLGFLIFQAPARRQATK
jgi:apolipoprotein N-acyltransferase